MDEGKQAKETESDFINPREEGYSAFRVEPAIHNSKQNGSISETIITTDLSVHGRGQGNPRRRLHVDAGLREDKLKEKV